MEKYYSMKEVAQITGLSEHTLRFYEKQQLILNIKRDSNNYRLYSDFDIQWIQFLTKVKSTNMPLKDIQKYAELMAKGNSTLAEREEMLLKHKQRIAEQISTLSDILIQIDNKLLRYQRIREGIGQKDLEIYNSLTIPQDS
ncbi:MAG: MerR family transcriptional regulator [Lachnospiraceae bacterium]|nr:MerR family transcriptional regulator [Lachnospiraceae bacterium]